MVSVEEQVKRVAIEVTCVLECLQCVRSSLTLLEVGQLLKERERVYLLVERHCLHVNHELH